MAKIIRNLGLAAIASLGLAACGGGGSGGITSTTPTTPTSTAAFQDQFGTAFAADFNASATANATDPAATDVPALNLTAEPIAN